MSSSLPKIFPKNWRKNKYIKKCWPFIKNYQVSLILALIGLLFIGAGLSISKFATNRSEPKFISAENETGESGGEIKIDIAGAVNKPGIYSLSNGSRIGDAVEKASGFSAEADSAWIAQNLNLAAKLTDGQKIYIPRAGEAVSGTATSSVSGKININNASSEQLDTLPGIGPVTAQKIISGRPYSSIQELLSKKAVGVATFEKIKDKISTF